MSEKASLALKSVVVAAHCTSRIAVDEKDHLRLMKRCSGPRMRYANRQASTDSDRPPAPAERSFHTCAQSTLNAFMAGESVRAASTIFSFSKAVKAFPKYVTPVIAVAFFTFAPEARASSPSRSGTIRAGVSASYRMGSNGGIVVTVTVTVKKPPQQQHETHHTP